MKRVAALAAIVVMASLAAITPASASQLNVAASRESFAQSSLKCASQTLAAMGVRSGAGTYSQVRLTGMRPTCAGLNTTVFLHRANGTLITQGTATSTVSTTTVTMGAAFTPSDVARTMVKINGWVFAPTFGGYSCVPLSPAGVVLTGAGDACTVTSMNVTTATYYLLGFIPISYTNANYTVSTTATRFRMAFDFAQPPFSSGTPQRVGGDGAATAGYDCTSLPVASIDIPIRTSGAYTTTYSTSQWALNVSQICT